MQPVNMDSLQLQATTFILFYTFAYPVKYQTWSLKTSSGDFWASPHQRRLVYSKKKELQENFKNCTHFGE